MDLEGKSELDGKSNMMNTQELNDELNRFMEPAGFRKVSAPIDLHNNIF